MRLSKRQKSYILKSSLCIIVVAFLPVLSEDRKVIYLVKTWEFVSKKVPQVPKFRYYELLRF